MKKQKTQTKHYKTENMLCEGLKYKIEHKQRDAPVDEKGFTELKKSYVALLIILSTVKYQVDEAIEYAKLLNNIINPVKELRLALIEDELESILLKFLPEIDLLLRRVNPERAVRVDFLLLQDVNKASREYDVERVHAFKALLREVSAPN
jgi:hypothetical protein